MAYNSNIMTSIFGRRIGLQRLSSQQTGGSRGPVDLLVGPEDLRQGVSTNNSTSVNLRAWGINRLIGTSAASTVVYTIDPPIPGVRVQINFASTDSAIYAKMSAGCSITGTSLGSTVAATIRSSGGGTVELMGLTTALFAALAVSSSAVNATEFQATT